MRTSLQLAITIGMVSCISTKNPLTEVFSWKIVDYEYPSKQARLEAIKKKTFIPENNLPLGIERWKNKLFVSLPRWKSGTPACLACIDLNTKEKSPKFKPYPNWDAHQVHSGSTHGKLVNVFRMNVDVCDRLWIQDEGGDNLLGDYKIIKRGGIHVYDLHTDKLIREYTLPEEIAKPESFIVNIIVETSKEDCNKAYAYLSDLRNQLIVYSYHDNESWSVKHPYFAFDPLATDFNVGGVNFQWLDGIFGLALSPAQKDGSRKLYFSAQSTPNEFCVSTKILQNKTLHVPKNAAWLYHKIEVLGSRGPNSQSTAQTLDPKTGVLFYTQCNKNGVGCFNTFNNKPYDTSTNFLIAHDNTTMIFPNDIKVDKEGTLWVTTDRLPILMYDKLNYNDVNFRIMKGSVKQIIKGTVCDKM